MVTLQGGVDNDMRRNTRTQEDTTQAVDVSLYIAEGGQKEDKEGDMQQQSHKNIKRYSSSEILLRIFNSNVKAVNMYGLET